MDDAEAAAFCSLVVGDVFAAIDKTHQLTNDDVRTLLANLPRDVFMNALAIVDAGGVVEWTSMPSRRIIYQVQGSCAHPYTVLPHHCTCSNFVQNVIVKRSTLHCAHTLAARLAHALLKVHARQMSDVDYTHLLGVDLNV